MNVTSALPMEAIAGPTPTSTSKSSAAPSETPAVVLSFLEIIGTLLGNDVPAESLLPPNASAEEDSERPAKSTDDANVPSDMLLAMQAPVMPARQVQASTAPLFVSRLSTPTTFVDTRSSKGAVVRLNIGDGAMRRNAVVTGSLSERKSAFEFLSDTATATIPSQTPPDAIGQTAPADVAARGAALNDVALNDLAPNEITLKETAAKEVLAKDLADVGSDLLSTSTAGEPRKAPVASAAGTMLGGMEDAPTPQHVGRMAQQIDAVYAESRKAGTRSKKVEGEVGSGYQDSMFAPTTARTFDTGDVAPTVDPAPMSSVDDLPEAPAAPFSHVTVRLSEEAGGGQVVISLRGGVLRARIVAPDETATRAIERGIGELHGALIRHGFEETHVTVETRVPMESVAVASAVVETPTTPKDTHEQDTSSRDRREEQRPYEDPRSGSRQSNGRSHQRARQERER